MKIYYSHSKLLKNTQVEELDIKLLEDLGFTVDNPYHAKYMDLWETEGFRFGEMLIDGAEAFAFRALPNGQLSSGVGKELKYAISQSKLVIELPFALVSRILNMDETMEFFRETGN